MTEIEQKLVNLENYIEGINEINKENFALMISEQIKDIRKLLFLHGVGSSSLGLVTITNTSVLLLHRKRWQIYKKGWNKHQDIYGRKWWIKYNY